MDTEIATQKANDDKILKKHETDITRVYDRLISRKDVWAQQARKPDESGKFGYFKKDSLTPELILRSVETTAVTIGAYCINNKDNTVRNPQIDIDNHDGNTDVRTDAKKIYDELVKAGAHPYIEASSGTIEGGAHIGIICQPTPAGQAKCFLENILKKLALDHEVFPKQTEIGKDGFGNLVKLPFQYNNRTRSRSTILDPETLEPMETEQAVEYMLGLPDTHIPETGQDKIRVDKLGQQERTDILEFLEDPGNKIKPCVVACFKEVWVLHGKNDEGHNFRFAVCTELIGAGASDEMVLEYFSIQPDFSVSDSKYQINQIREKGYKATGCKKLRTQCKTLLKDRCETCERKPVKRTKTEDSEVQPQEDAEEVPQHIKDRAFEIMTTNNPVKFILDTHQKMHVGDENLAKNLLVSIGCQSVLNSDGIHPKVSGESGKGKTHCCKTMAHLLPKEYCIEGTLSDKVIYYMEDELKPGSVVFSDDVDLSGALEGVIKRATTNYQSGDIYRTMDVNRNPRTLTIPPRVAWWLTSVDDDQSLQLLNRQFSGGVDESPEQDEKVLKFQKEKDKEGSVGLPVDDDVELCREIFRQIKKRTFHVKIPYADGIEWRDKSNRRNYPIFSDIIKAFAVLRFRQRPIVDGYLLAAIEDYEAAKELYCSRAENQGLKLTGGELKLCRTLHQLSQLQGECDLKDLVRALGLSRGRVHQLIHGRKDRQESGLIHKVKGLHVERRTTKTDEDESTTKNFYSIEGFDALGSFGDVVSLSEESKADYYHYYHTVTPLLPKEKNNSRQNVTKVTLNKNTEDSQILEIDQLSKNDKKPDSLSVRSQKTCNSGKSHPLDSENDGNSVGNSAVTTHDKAAQHIENDLVIVGTVLPEDPPPEDNNEPTDAEIAGNSADNSACNSAGNSPMTSPSTTPEDGNTTSTTAEQPGQHQSFCWEALSPLEEAARAARVEKYRARG